MTFGSLGLIQICPVPQTELIRTQASLIFLLVIYFNDIYIV